MRHLLSRSLPLAILSALLLFDGGCAGPAGFDREAMRMMLKPDSGAAGESASTGTSEIAPALVAPFKLALYFVENAVPHRHGLRNVDWLSTDKDALVRRLAPLRDERVVSDIFLLADPTVQGHDTRKIRQAAGRHGMDAVLIVERIGAVDRFTNGYAALYPTLIGAYFAPGTECDALVMIEGSLWDVRSDRLHTTQFAEGAWKTVGPAMSVEDSDVLAKATREAFEKFADGVAGQIRGMKSDRGRSTGRLR